MAAHLKGVTSVQFPGRDDRLLSVFRDWGRASLGADDLSIFQGIESDHGLARSVCKVHDRMLNHNLVVLVQTPLGMNDDVFIRHKVGQHG